VETLRRRAFAERGVSALSRSAPQHRNDENLAKRLLAEDV